MYLESQWDPDRLATLSEEQLKIERANLLECIDNIEHNTDSDKEKPAYIEHLWNTNNPIIDLLSKFHLIPRMDPAEKLPLELFCAIIVYAVADYASIPPEKTNNSLILTLVSERWRDILLGIPQLWNEIIVSVNHQDCASKFTLFLELSKPLPIRLDIYDWRVGDLDIFPALFQCRDRINKITLPLGYSPWTQQWSQDSLNALNRLTTLRNLKHIVFFGDNGPDQWSYREILKRFTSLQEIPGLVITPDLFRHDSIRHLRSAAIQGNLDLLNMVHGSMPMLNNVIFNQNELFRSQESDLIDSLSTTQIDQSELPWSYLSCWHHSPSTPKAMRDAMHRMVNLSFLNLALSLPQLQVILAGLRHLSVLEMLALRLKTVPEVRIEQFSKEDIHPNSQVKFLKLDTSDFGCIEGLGDYRDSLNINETLLKAIPAIETVELTYPSGLESLGCYDWRGFTELKRMYLENRNEINIPIRYEFPMSLSWVSLRISHKRVSGLLSSKVTHLSFQPDVPEDGLSISIYAREWPELRSFITTVPFQLYEQDSKFNHLKSITIYSMPGPSATDSPYEEVMNATRLCIRIAMRPEDLPSLEDITMRCSPHWDILLLMLKRRNLVNRGGFVPLKTLWIPMFPRELETVLWSLMNGRNPEWPSMHDISLHGILELLQDNSV
jgi:hypothetical protein